MTADRTIENVHGWDFSADDLDPLPSDEFVPDFVTIDLSDAISEGSL